jgi:hypothetical protein
MEDHWNRPLKSVASNWNITSITSPINSPFVRLVGWIAGLLAFLILLPKRRASSSWKVRFGQSELVLQSQLSDDIDNSTEAKATGVERHIVESRIVNLHVEVTPQVAPSGQPLVL